MDIKTRLVVASILLSFVEMTLIRWVSSNIYQIFFFTNFIMIASFLGIGIGFLRAHKTKSYFYLSPVFLAIIVLFCYAYSVDYQVKINPKSGNIDYLVSAIKASAYPIFLTLPIIFIAVVATLASIADMVAKSFKQLPSLSAYRLEVLGFLTGIILFSLCAYIQTSPMIWGVVISLLYIMLFFDTWRAKQNRLMFIQLSAIVMLAMVFYKESTHSNHIWSSYYKIQIKPFLENSYVVNVNGLAQQIIEPIAQRKKIKPFYTKPYEHMPENMILDNVLVIGAGTGGDVAIALSYGAKHVDAVEIDPALYELGKKLNIDKPYQDPRVNVIINDGRAFLQQTKQSYDLIIYALTDSLMLVPGLSSVRLENYLYTLEGLTAAYNHLKSDGVFTIYNYYGAQWFAERLANTLSTIYKHPSCFDVYSPQDYWATVLTISPNQSLLSCNVFNPNSAEYIHPATDSHPFIYLKDNTFPLHYLFSLIVMGFISYTAIRKMGGSLKAISHYFDLFLMGSAFLLLETAGIVNYALLFGTTWIVNSLVFSGIMLSVYFAIEVASRFKMINVYFLYGLLLISLLVAWIVPIHSLLSYGPIIRLLLATCLMFTPIFIANLIFAERFDEVSMSTDALGVNLIGAVAGGFLEYISLVIGYQHFAILILIIYTMAFAWLNYSKKVVLN